MRSCLVPSGFLLTVIHIVAGQTTRVEPLVYSASPRSGGGPSWGL